MKKTFCIYGDIVDNEELKITQDDICPRDFKNFVDGFANIKDIEVEIKINSCGGSVSAGVSIANQILQLSKAHKTTAIIEGIAASIASVIACACDDVVMGKSSYMMIHKVWGCVQGNGDDLRKEADIMDMMTKSLLSFYHRKFDLGDDELLELLAAETWISGAQAEDYKLKVTILDDDSDVGYRYAAKLIDKMQEKFNNVDNIKEKIISMENLDTEVKEETKVNEQTDSTNSELATETNETNETVEENNTVEEEEGNTEIKSEVEPEKPSYEELQKMVDDLTKENEQLKKALDEKVENEDVEKRISKCQSTFQNKINGFKDELRVKDEELANFKNSLSNLKTELENSKKELQEMSAAFAEKNNALEKLNSSVLSNPDDTNEVNWRELKGQDFFNWVESHKEEIKNLK